VRGEKKISTRGWCKEEDLERITLSLMYACRNWGTEECHHEISKWKSMDRMRENEGVILSPINEEADEICRNCKAQKIR